MTEYLPIALVCALIVAVFAYFLWLERRLHRGGCDEPCDLCEAYVHRIVHKVLRDVQRRETK